MQASVVASFLVFVMTGAYTMLARDLPFKADIVLKTLLFLTILFNACFFFYYEIYTESSSDMRQRLKDARPTEWWLRVFAQAQLFNLWFVLPQWGWVWFYVCLCALYVTYIGWDIHTWKCFKDRGHPVFIWDVSGLVASLIGLFVFIRLASQDLRLQMVGPPAPNTSWVADDRTYMLVLGIVTAFYGFMFLFGVATLRKSQPTVHPFRDFNENLV